MLLKNYYVNCTELVILQNGNKRLIVFLMSSFSLDPLYSSLLSFRSRRPVPSLPVSSSGTDLSLLVLSLRSVIQQSYTDDWEMEDLGISDLVMAETTMDMSTGRVGTSVGNRGMVPMTAAGRPVSGYVRPGTQGKVKNMAEAFEGQRPGTMRPVSVQGRYARIGTASMLAGGKEKLVNAEAINVKKIVKKPAFAKAVCDYLLYVEHNPKKALELAIEATQAANFKDWWWKARLGKCYYQLGMYRDAEKQFKSALKHQEMVLTYLELAKVYLRLEQPSTALETYLRASEKFPGDIHLILGIARVHESLNDMTKAVQHYKKVLHFDAANAEAIACLASYHFYNDQQELSLRFYRRLLQMGINNSEIWNNIGLCCFYSSQYDLTLNCFEKALALATDENTGDIWYNIGHVSIGIGDLNLAYQAFKIAISIDPKHSEAFNNIGVLEMRKSNYEQARSNFQTSSSIVTHNFEPLFNNSLLSFKLGDCQDSFDLATKALDVYPDHSDSIELLQQLKRHFTHL